MFSSREGSSEPEDRLVLRGARHPGDVAIVDGRITAVGIVAPASGDKEVHCEGDIITAGLVNTHHHLYQWLTRGRATGCDLFPWLVEPYPVWGRLSVAAIPAADITTGQAIADAIHPVGKDAVVTVEESNTFGMDLDFVAAMPIDKGSPSPHFASDPQRQ